MFASCLRAEVSLKALLSRKSGNQLQDCEVRKLTSIAEFDQGITHLDNLVKQIILRCASQKGIAGCKGKGNQIDKIVEEQLNIRYAL